MGGWVRILGVPEPPPRLRGTPPSPPRGSPVFSSSVLGVLGRLMISTRLVSTMGT